MHFIINLINCNYIIFHSVDIRIHSAMIIFFCVHVTWFMPKKKKNDRENDDRSLIDHQRHPTVFDESRNVQQKPGDLRFTIYDFAIAHTFGGVKREQESLSYFGKWAEGVGKGSRRIFFWLLG